MNRNRSVIFASRWLGHFSHLLVCFVAIWSFSLPTYADESGIDVVLVMDSSGSMAKNDPDKLRVPAAKLFMSLLSSDDRIGLISFSDNGYPVLHLSTPGPKNNARILASADRVSSKGVYTNLHAAVTKGIEMLDKEGKAGREKMLVVMSDGKMDVGNTDDDWSLTQKLEGAVLQAASDKNIKIYTIAFTEASDSALLKKIAADTGALFKLARSDADLHEVFSAIFESAKSPDMLPIEGNEFEVDNSISEVTIVASKERSDVLIYLQDPDGNKLGSDDAGKNLKWFASQHFDMITVANPTPGTWKLISTDGKNRAYIVTDISLQHNPLQPNKMVEEDISIEAWLEQESEVLDREALLTNTTFQIEITAPSGNTDRFDLHDTGKFGDRKPADGVYTNTLAYENPGPYQISILALGETFKRQKTIHFEVSAPAPSLAVVSEEPVVSEPEAEPEPVPEPEAVSNEEEIDEESDEASTEPEEETDEESVTEPEPKKGMGMGIAIGIFAAANLLLGLIGGGIWWFLKKRKKSADDTDDEDEDDDDDKVKDEKN